MTNEHSLPGVRTDSDSTVLFAAERVPVLQNRVYGSLEQAREAKSGCLEIRFDREQSFAWNARFEPSLIVYDDDYDNSVPSQRFLEYYDSIADYLVRKYDLANGPVVDVGCGKGTFLERLVARHPHVTGIGVDPAYEGPSRAASGRLTFFAEPFRERHIPMAPSLVLCRHTLEHIPDPTTFLRSILAPLKSSEAPIPIFAEVPDLDWIVSQNAFWDFCYEHVNYFTATSFARCLERAGAVVTGVTPSFGDQYLWAEGVVNGSGTEDLPAWDSPASASDCGDQLARDVSRVMSRLAELSVSHDLVVWGMATKGVMYSMCAAQHGIRLEHCVDLNERKQGCFSPLTGIRIVSPQLLEVGARSKRYAVICMNPNYLAEVRGQCSELGVEADFFGADLHE